MLNKAQALSLDFFVAASIFLIIISVLLHYWINAIVQIEESRKHNELFEKAVRAAEIWFREGVPKYWSLANLKELGLENDWEINWSKVVEFGKLDYGRGLELIGVLPFNLFYNLTNETNHQIFSWGELPSSAKNLVKVERLGILNGSIVKIFTLVWE